MKVLNLIWGFTLGAGIDKCYLAYAKISEVDKDIEMLNVCIRLQNIDSHIEPLEAIGTIFIPIKNRWDISWLWKLKQLIRKEQPDVLFSHGFNGAIVLLAERILGVKNDVVLTYHGLYNPPRRIKKTVAQIYNRLSFRVYKHIAKKVICVSEDSRRQLLSRKVEPEKTVTIHNGIPAQSGSGMVALKGETINIVSCSRIDRIKGLGFLLEALALLRREKVPFYYYMIGEGPELENLKEQSRLLDLDDNISFVGYRDNVAEWLNASDIFVIPSLQENHSIAILEAMRAGKAIIATNIGGNGESICHNKEGLLVKAGDAESLYSALKRLINDEALRKRLAEAAKTRFETTFTEEAMLRKLSKVLREK